MPAIVNGLGPPRTTTLADVDNAELGDVALVTTVPFTDPGAVWMLLDVGWRMIEHHDRDDLADISELHARKYGPSTVVLIDGDYFQRDTRNLWTQITPTEVTEQPAPTVTGNEESGTLFVDRRTNSALYRLDEAFWTLVGHEPGAARVLGPFPFAWDDPDILTGVALYTPNVGEVLFAWAVHVTEFFDGAGTPTASLAPVGGSEFSVIGHAQINFAQDFDSGVSFGIGGAALFDNGTGLAFFEPDTEIGVFIDDGAGGDPESSQGQADLYLVVASPVLLTEDAIGIPAHASSHEAGGDDPIDQPLPVGALAGAARVLGPFPFAFDDPDILTGQELYTPSVGDVILDAWVQVPTTWHADDDGGVTLSIEAGPGSDNVLLSIVNLDMSSPAGSHLETVTTSGGAVAYSAVERVSLDFVAKRAVPAVVLDATPIAAVVVAGDVLDAGEANLYLVVASPFDPNA